MRTAISAVSQLIVHTCERSVLLLQVTRSLPIFYYRTLLPHPLFLDVISLCLYQWQHISKCRCCSILPVFTAAPCFVLEFPIDDSSMTVVAIVSRHRRLTSHRRCNVPSGAGGGQHARLPDGGDGAALTARQAAVPHPRRQVRLPRAKLRHRHQGRLSILYSVFSKNRQQVDPVTDGVMHIIP